MTIRKIAFAFAAVPFAIAASGHAAPLINEIHFHPGHAALTPEPVGQEWIEIYNPDGGVVDLASWQFTKGVTFTFPAASSLAPGGYVVVAANPAQFAAAHPGYAGVVFGPWTGRLSNGGEQIQLEDNFGNVISDFSYADDGDWAFRARGPLSSGHKGWIWVNEADGGGKTMELRNWSLGNGSGQNWGTSAAAGGTPGAVNSIASGDIAPLIKNARHKPEIPRSTDPIRFSCTVEDEFPGGTATLHWRLDGAANFTSVPMTDSDGDGDLDAQILAQGNLAIVEWYISASDGANTRTWPAAARTSDIGVAPATFAQAANALLQVDNSFNPAQNFTVAGNQPVLRMVMASAERQELAQLQTTSGQEDSEATFNAAFISHDGTGTKVVQNAGVRNRGFSSALGPPSNFHVGFPNQDSWRGRGSIQLNCQFGYSQALGNVLFARAGLASHDAAVVQVRVNGVDPAESGSRMFGRYAMLEGRGGDWAGSHYPLDPDGNFYRADDHAPNADTGIVGNDRGSGEFLYEGTAPASWSDTFFKETNVDDNDYTDLGNLTRIVSAESTGGSVAQPAINDADYPSAVATVLDVAQFYKFMACDALIGNQEGGLQSGRADDFSLYRGVVDPRFRFVPHDMDDVFDIGNGAGNPITRSIFSYDEFVQQGNTGVVGLRRMFSHPAMVPKYYAALLDALNTWFNHETIDPLIDQIMQGWVPATDGSSATPNRGVTEIKGYIDVRRTNVLSQIQQNYALSVTGTAADSLEGYKVTTTGAATISGTFNVARTYSITVNGVAAQAFYRTNGADAAGTWKLVTTAGGSGVLHPGLNNVVVKFWDGINGTGTALQTLNALVLYQPAAPTYTDVSGTLTPPGSLSLLAPASYVPGVPFLVRVDLKDVQGNLNRSAWNTTVNLAGTNNVVVTPSTLTLYNGMGSALISLGSTSGGGTVTYFTYGTGGTGSAAANTGTVGSTWKYRGDFTPTTLAAFVASSAATWKNEGFDDSAWPGIVSQTGYGDGDENRAFTRVDYDTAAALVQSGPVYLFRNTFTVADISQLLSVSGQVKFDDSCAVYVNGTQVYRHADLTPNAPLTEYTEVSTATTQENATGALSVPLNLLHNGVNTIAVEVHQHDAGSSDVTFDLQLSGTLVSTTADPGNFTLSATAGPLAATKAIISAGSNPAMTNVSGALPAGTTNWSGIMNVTGDVTVPTGSTLNIAAGAIVLMNGTAAAGDTAGADLIVNSGGTLAINGTAGSPVTLTSRTSAGRWGQIFLNGANPTVCSYALMSRGGHAPGVGHTSKGPMWRLTGANLTFNDSAMGDGPAKAMYSSGTCDFTMQRSLMARMITGPEVENGTAILIEDSNIQEILPHYRENNEAPDDEDCLYVHNGTGRPVNVRRTVFARCGDDVFDCLGGPITVEDTILREGWDKGMSLLNNDLTISRTLIVDCDKAIVPKSDSATTRTTTVNRCTIYSENHNTTLAPWGYSVPPTAPDADSPSTGLYTQNKAGQSNAGATIAINAKDCIIVAESPILVDAPYSPANTVVTYSITRDTDTPATAAWTGTGNSNADPLWVNLAGDDYHLQAASPARDTGDPASSLDADGSRADMGVYPYSAGGGGGAGEVVWTMAGGPYRVTANTTVPTNLTLRINAGVAVYFAQNARLTVNGRLLAEGTAAQRITFSHVPGTNVATDVDPIKNGTQTGAPKWGGIRVYDSMGQENAFRYCDFINAQGTSPSGSENYGSVGFVRSWGWVDHCTFAGTHLRMCYGRNSKLTVTHTNFPDMFIFDAALNRIEEPTTDFLAAADNSMEPLKVEFPTTDPEVSGNANYPNGLPINGHWRVYYNDFHGNRGHQDVFDADSGRWAARDAVTNFQSNGQFVLDCRYNHFYGRTGDEHIDLGGDAFIASNVFENGRKDYWTNDTGYSNAISSGDKGSGTTIMVVRNTCYDLDHVINCKANTATIFEHNTVANLHADFQFQGQTVTQNVVCAPVNFFIPGDGASPTNGDGAYLGYNIISNVAHVFSGPDASASGPVDTKIEFFHNLLDQIADPVIGPRHSGGYFSGTYGPNKAGAPGFVDAVNENYGLAPGSAALGTAPGGLNYGSSVAEWAYILNAPPARTQANTAGLTIGGPGIVAYKWRLDGGAWSAPIQIGSGGVLPRAAPTVRQAALNLSGLANGLHTLEVLGQDMAGNWQDNDPARTLEGLAQAAPTSISWTVDTTFVPLLLSEIRAYSAPSAPDAVELHNAGATPVDLTGWTLTDSAGNVMVLDGQIAPAGSYYLVQSMTLPLGAGGDTLELRENGVLRDSVTFGPQAPDYTLGRHPITGAWCLCVPGFGLANTPQALGDPSVVVINEWLVSGDVRYKDDWVELANPSTLPVSISGMRLSDNRFGTVPPFPPLSFIGPLGFLKLTADGNAAAGASHTAFKMDGITEELLLFGADGAELDVVRYFPQVADVSQGRTATGGVGGFDFFTLATGGMANGTTDPGYQNAVAILNSLRITEIMYWPAGGGNYEFIELTNTGAVTLDLSGVQFFDGIDFTFPGGFALAPGAQTVLVADLAAFQSRYGLTVNVAGVYTGRIDNNGEQLALRLREPWDANVLCFRYESFWYPDTNGAGKSMVLLSNATDIHDFDEKSSWGASTETGGSPAGYVIPPDPHPDGLAQWLTANLLTVGDLTLDTDFDGLTNIMEFSMNTNPRSPAPGQGADRMPSAGKSPDGYATITFDLPSSTVAGGHGCPGITYEVYAGTQLINGGIIARKSPTGASWTNAANVALPPGSVTLTSLPGGRTRVTVKDNVLTSVAVRRLIYLKVIYTP